MALGGIIKPVKTMKISAEIVADSRNPQGDRITTMMVTFPRYILAELNTHRMFSRNSASSRAIPFKKMLESVEKNPFVPIAWQKDHKGMQGFEYFTNSKAIEMCEFAWLRGARYAAECASELYGGDDEEKVTKQLCNRILEPYLWHTVLITSTEWSNFFNLRSPQYVLRENERPDGEPGDCHYKSRKQYIRSCSGIIDCAEWTEMEWLQRNVGQAEIHTMALTEAMWDARNESIPKELQPGEWHIPFGEMDLAEFLTDIHVHPEAYDQNVDNYKIKIATARCARVSYTVVGEEDKESDYKKDIQLHDRLLDSGHFSPFEHCAKAMTDNEYISYHKGQLKFGTHEDDEEFDIIKPNDNQLGWCLNFKGFIQYRALI